MPDNNQTLAVPPIRKDKEIEMKKMEIETVNRVISDTDLKTQFTQGERMYITLLEELSDKPFTISERISKEIGVNFDMKRYQFPLLKECIKGYCRKGKALNRKGIGEDVDIVSAYFQAQIERAKASEHKPSVLTK